MFSIIVMVLQRYSLTIMRSAIRSSDATRASLFRGLNAIDTIKVSGSEESFYRLWSHSIYLDQSNTMKSQNMMSCINLVRNMQSVFISVTILGFGGFLISKGEITMGMLMGFQTVFSSFSNSMLSVASTGKQVMKIRTTQERMEDVFSEESKEEVKMSPEKNYYKLKGKIEIENLSYCYNKGEEPAISDINLSVNQGEAVALVGRSGCGKSTLMKIISGVYPEYDGKLTFDGKTRKEIPDTVFYSSIASVNQDINMFETNIKNNLKMWDSTIEDYEVILAAVDAQIHNRILKERQGYLSDVSTDGKNFSGGERQRLELARALSQEPTILLLDEFTSALDADTEDKVFRGIKNRSVSCIIAAHRFSTVVQCDKIVVMDQGRIVEVGTHQELYKKNGLYRQLIEDQ